MKLNRLFSLGLTKHGNNQPAAHMTFATSKVGRSLSQTGLFLRKQLWIWPIIAVVVLTIVGLFVRSAIETTMKDSLRSQISTTLDIEAAMLETWLNSQKDNAESMANDLETRQIAYGLLEPGGSEEHKVVVEPVVVRAKLDKALGPGLSAHDYVGYFVADRKKQIVASSNPEILGLKDVDEYDSFLSNSLNGIASVSPPFPGVAAVKDSKGRLRTGIPTMWVSAPVRDESFQVIGVLALRIRPEAEFTRILQLGRIGQTGETYAFDKTGRMVSNSRFDDQMILSGLLPDEIGSTSLLKVLLRDPGGDVTKGHRPTARRDELPLTHMAAEAIVGRPGVDVDGYRDYRGVLVVGAWKWLPDANLGIATEIDYSEAFRPLAILRWTFWGLFALLALSAVAIFIFTIIAARWRREAQKAAIKAQQIGQYTLEQKLGSGGMGVVYRGHHSMLRRPTAIKMLDVDKVNEASMERFEREVQITSQLNHPNTVAIYDYGRTPEGVFYYAMEYLDGIDLQALVERYGPLPAPRAIHILQQVCGSLYEAHSLGLVHRDIKPANIMLNRRGGEPDVVKVLDFGLVKALDDEKSKTDQRGLTGTPLYMSPEAIQMPNSVDARSDLYAVGAVGYFLLTGLPVFDADSVVDLCHKHVATPPTPPSQRANISIPPELENALLSCLEKSRAKRPQTARDLSQLISRCQEALRWSIEEADAWWGRHERGQGSMDVPKTPNPASGTASRGYDLTMDQQ
ncbi:MAG: serine/threonine protein kinase [Pirellulales bacterium]|nr:serine/threonine protein kinase [Pirellulales bacterium]